MKYTCLLIIYSLFSCNIADQKVEHRSYHELDSAPFTYSSEFEDSELLLSITPKAEGEVFFPAFIKYSDSDENFIGDLVFSTSKVNSDLYYSQELTDKGVNTIVVIPVEKIKQPIREVNLNVAVHVCKDCFDVEEIENFKAHKYSHVWGKHYHIKVAAETD